MLTGLILITSYSFCRFLLTSIISVTLLTVGSIHNYTSTTEWTMKCSMWQSFLNQLCHPTGVLRNSAVTHLLSEQHVNAQQLSPSDCRSPPYRFEVLPEKALLRMEVLLQWVNLGCLMNFNQEKTLTSSSIPMRNLKLQMCKYSCSLVRLSQKT